MARFFMSYRRGDSAGHAGRLADRLREQFGRDQVFFDLDIAPGVEFADHIRTTIAGCDAAIVVIGPGWAQATGPDGTRRLDDPGDLVRLEVESALAQSGVTTIPVLVEGASIPKASDLPESLRPLVGRNALEITDSRFDYDAGRLVDALRQITGAVRPSRPSRTRRAQRMLVLVAATVVVVAGAAALFAFRPTNVTVPDVVGAPSAFVAEKTLTAKGLELAPEVKHKVSNSVPPGTVIAQTPGTGERAEKGSEVMVQVAIGSRQVAVPNLAGKTVINAEKLLRSSRLSLGSVAPAGAAPTAHVSSQVPAKGEIVKEGTQVSVGTD